MIKKIFTLILIMTIFLSQRLLFASNANLSFSFDGDDALVSLNGDKVTLGGGAIVMPNGRNGGYVKLEQNSSSYLEIPTSSLVELEEMTISLWVGLEGEQLAYSRIFEIGSIENGMGKTYIDLAYSENDGGLRICASKNGPSREERIHLNADLEPTGWAHLILSINRDGQYDMYINGKLIQSVKLGTKLSDITIDKFYIGKSFFPSDPYINAKFDDIDIYPYAINANDVDNLAGLSNQEAFNLDMSAITFNQNVTATKLNLPTQGKNGTVVKWESSDSSVITKEGYVYREKNEDVNVTLTATFTRGELQEMKTYNLVVKVTNANMYADVMQPTNVTLNDSGEFYEAKMLNKEYMLSLDVNRLLVNYYKTSGIETEYEEYGGWITEANNGAGTIEAHYLSALTYLYVEENDPEILTRINQYVTAWKDCQERFAILNPEHAGYFGAVGLWQLDQLEQYGTAPWTVFYIIEKHLSALYDVYTYLGNEVAYDILIKYADYISSRVNNYDEAMMNRVMRVEYGGISMIMFKLYGLTKNNNYLLTAQRFCEPYVFDTIEAGGDPFAYKHANTAIPKVYGAAWGYVVTGNPYYLDIAIKGFKVLTEGRAFCTGNISEVEELHPQYENDTIGFQSCETCCGYNMMRYADLLYRITGDKAYMDYYERVLYNTILSSIDPETGMKTYYVSMDSGYYKVYHTAETSFWCCTGTGFENFAKLNQNIYYVNDEALTINLFINSTVKDEKSSLVLSQDSNFPNSQVVTINVLEGANRTVKIRNPYWTYGQTKMSINGKLVDLNLDDKGYITINKTFEKGDVIKLHLPMSFRLERLESNTQPNSNAIMYGPLVMSGTIESIGEISPILTNSNIGKSDSHKIKEELFYSTDSLFDNIEKIDDLTYRLKVDNQEVTIKAFYKCHREMYIIYWDIYQTNTAEYSKFLANESYEKSMFRDEVVCGNWFSENPHNFKSEGTWIGNYATENNRGLVKGGWMSYDMKVEEDLDNELRIMHYGTDSGYSYNIYINGEKMYTTSVESIGKKFYWKIFDLPASVCKNGVINVKIECIEGTLTTGLYKIRTYRRGLPNIVSEGVTLNENEEKLVSLHNKLLDLISIAGTGDIVISASFDGINYQDIYNGKALVELKQFAQYHSIKIKALTSTRFDLNIYGDEVEMVEDINYTLSVDTDLYAPEQYAKVTLKNAGTVYLRIDWSRVGPIRGMANGDVTLHNTSLKTHYSISTKKLNDGLEIYYDFENINGKVLEDKTANNFDGTLCGDVSINKGRYGQGINLGGINGYVALPELDGKEAITLSLWVNFNDNSNVLYQRIFDLGNDRFNYLTMAACGYAAGNHNGSISQVNDKVYDFKVNEWYHYALTVEGSLAITYLNGVELSRSELFEYDLKNLAEYVSSTIGKAHIDYTPYLNATIDEFRLYNYALSKDQITGLYKLNDIDTNAFAAVDEEYIAIEEEKVEITIPEDNPINPAEPTNPTEPAEPTNPSTGCLGGIGSVLSTIVLLISMLGIIIIKRR